METPKKGEFPLLKKLSAEDKIALNQIEKGDEVWFVRDTFMAAAMCGAGFYLRLDPPYTYQIKDNKPLVTWNFISRSNEGIHAKEFLKHWRNWETWVPANPDHPHAGAISAVQHAKQFMDWIKNVDGKPYIPYESQDGEKTIYVKHGTRRHKNVIASGLKQQ